jgi:hypothetical protein
VKRLALLVVGLVPLVPHEARAQVRWDAEVQGGFDARWLTSRVAGVGNADIGPEIGLSGHIALVPLVRAGLYVEYEEASTIPNVATRQLFGVGLDGRVYSPWPRGDERLYGRVGIGERFTFAGRSVFPDGGVVGSTDGAFTEVPLAIGFTDRFAPSVSITAELGARVGFGFVGGAYHARFSPGSPTIAYDDDTLALYFDIGVQWGG